MGYLFICYMGSFQYIGVGAGLHTQGLHDGLLAQR